MLNILSVFNNGYLFWAIMEMIDTTRSIARAISKIRNNPKNLFVDLCFFSSGVNSLCSETSGVCSNSSIIINI